MLMVFVLFFHKYSWKLIRKHCAEHVSSSKPRWDARNLVSRVSGSGIALVVWLESGKGRTFVKTMFVCWFSISGATTSFDLFGDHQMIEIGIWSSLPCFTLKFYFKLTTKNIRLSLPHPFIEMPMIRFVTLICLLVVSNRSLIRANTVCRCECCLTDGCRPVSVGSQPLWFCSEQLSCTQAKCVEWHANRCPIPNSFGQTRAICVSSGRRIQRTGSVLLSLFIFAYRFRWLKTEEEEEEETFPVVHRPIKRCIWTRWYLDIFERKSKTAKMSVDMYLPWHERWFDRNSSPFFSSPSHSIGSNCFSNSASRWTFGGFSSSFSTPWSLVSIEYSLTMPRVGRSPFPLKTRWSAPRLYSRPTRVQRRFRRFVSTGWKNSVWSKELRLII